jgi:hypothetical protein
MQSDVCNGNDSNQCNIIIAVTFDSINNINIDNDRVAVAVAVAVA